MVSVTPLASRPKISKIIIDSDLNMGDFDVTATDVTATGNLKVEGVVGGDLDVSGNISSGGDIVASGSITAGGYIVKPNYTIAPNGSSATVVVSVLGSSGCYLMMLPPNVTMSGSIKLKASAGSSVKAMFLNATGLAINSTTYLSTAYGEYTVPGNTNAIYLYNYVSSNVNVAFGYYKIS